jgi:hypothetical protein
MAVVPDILVKYRQHGLNMTSNNTNMFEGRLRVLDAYKCHRLYPRAMSLTYASAAHGSSEFSRTTTLRHLASALKYSFRIVPTPNFIESLLRISFPRAFLRAVKRIIM